MKPRSKRQEFLIPTANFKKSLIVIVPTLQHDGDKLQIICQLTYLLIRFLSKKVRNVRTLRQGNTIPIHNPMADEDGLDSRRSSFMRDGPARSYRQSRLYRQGSNYSQLVVA